MLLAALHDKEFQLIMKTHDFFMAYFSTCTSPAYVATHKCRCT